MILYGRTVSPFVRRVAIWLDLQGRAYENVPLLVMDDFEKLKTVNPIGRVPALKLDDGTVLVETWAITDFLEDTAPAGRKLLPATGPERTRALQGIACAHNAAEKGVALVYEAVRRPAELHWADWQARVRGQALTALQLLDGHVPSMSIESTPAIAAATVATYDFYRVMLPMVLAEGFAALRAFYDAANAHPAFAASRPPLPA
jgi:glutathione S-transferase